jgi:arginine deiminase
MPDARRAVALAATVQRMHPALLALRPTRYAPDRGLRRSAAQLDGDDVLLAADGSVVVGIGHRTSAHGARQLARTVLERCDVARVIVVRLPLDPRLDRLDRIIGLVDVGTALVHPSVYDDDRVSWSLDGIDPDTGELISGPPRAFRTVLDAVLGPDAAAPVVLPDLPRVAGPADYLPLEPGAVLTDAPPDDPTSARLERAGVEVVPVPDTAGPVGGLRRLVRPVSRDALRAA